MVSCSSTATVVPGISAAIDGTTYTAAPASSAFLLNNFNTLYSAEFTNLTLYEDTATHVAEFVKFKFLVSAHLLRHGAGV